MQIYSVYIFLPSYPTKPPTRAELLTKGDRRAASGFSDLSEFDLDSTFGKRALKRLYASLEGHGSAGRECDENIHYVAPSQGMNCVLDEFVQTANEKELKVLRKMDGGLNKWLLHENKDSTRTLTAPSARLLVLMYANQGNIMSTFIISQYYRTLHYSVKLL